MCRLSIDTGTDDFEHPDEPVPSDLVDVTVELTSENGRGGRADAKGSQAASGCFEHMSGGNRGNDRVWVVPA